MKKYYPSKWECMNCTDHNVIFLKLKGMSGIRSFNFHIQKQDIKELINDLKILYDNDDENHKIKIVHNEDK